MSAEIAHQAGIASGVGKASVPWYELARASQRPMIVGTGAEGGYLVGKQVYRAADALLPYMNVLRMGAQMFENLPLGNALFLRIGTSVSVGWPGELGTGTTADLVFEQAEAPPKKLVGVTTISRQLLKQAPGIADSMLARNLLSVAGAELDESALTGTGGDQAIGI